MWSDESACLPQSLRSRHLIAHENPPPSCDVSRYRSVRPLPLKEESGPFFLACAIAASGRLVRTMYATQSGESSAFSVIFSAFSDESLLLFTPSCPLSAGFSLAHGHSLRRWRKGAADRRCDVCRASRPPTGLASALGGGDKWQPECRAPSERARRCERGQPTSCSQRWNGVGCSSSRERPKRCAGTQKKPADARFTSAGAKMCSAVRCETARAAGQG